MATDTNVKHLIVNKMTQAQYDSAEKNADELYLTPEAPASTTNLGPVKVDGSTITADADGTIHAQGGGTVNDGKLTIKRNNVSLGEFTANQATDKEINITVPTVNDATLTIQKNGSSVGTFTANASSNKTINITTSQANWNQTSSSAEDYIKNKPTIPTVNNATLTIQKNGSSVGTFTANASANKTINITTPTKVSDLTYDIMDKIYPVGSIYMSATLSTAAQVKNALGGTWVAWGAGKVPVGVNASETEFNTVEKTGGEKTHALTVAEMPSHNHTIGGFPNGTQESWGGEYVRILYQTTVDNPYPQTSGLINYTGNDNPHNNLQPYITCYMYKRTA